MYNVTCIVNNSGQDLDNHLIKQLVKVEADTGVRVKRFASEYHLTGDTREYREVAATIFSYENYSFL